MLDKLLKEIETDLKELINVSENNCNKCLEYEFGREEDWCHECCENENCTKDHSDFAD